MKIGYIGLGALGSELARRFLAAHELCVWDIDAASTAPFEAAGARVAPTAAALASECDVVLICLPRSTDVRQLLFGLGGLTEGLTAGKLVIDQTSGNPRETRDFARQLALQGVGMVDAAVSASPQLASQGQATLMVSGSDADFELALPVLRVITPTIFRCGARVGDGQAMKVVNNAMNAGCRLGTLEVVAMGRKAGLSLECMTDVLNKGGARNQTTVKMLPAIALGQPSTNFALSLMLKDVNQAVALGIETGVPMPITGTVRGLLQIGANTLGKAARLEDMVGVIEGMAATRLAEPLESSVATIDATRTPAIGDLKIGFVGLGAMGGALARRLMTSCKLHVYDANADLLRTFGAEGAVCAPDLQSLGRTCDVILICLPTSSIVRKVLFGENGLADALSRGKLVIDQTSGDPDETRRLAADLNALGVMMIDAPVSGGPLGAAAGTIAIMTGGAPDAMTQAWPILASISPNVMECGPIGNGHVVKLVNNAISSLCRLVSYECVMAGVKYGLKLSVMADVLDKTSGWSVASRKILPSLVTGKQTANFQLQLMVKDLRLASNLAVGCGAPMMISTAVRSLMEVGVNELGPTANIEDMSRLYEAMAGASFETA